MTEEEKRQQTAQEMVDAMLDRFIVVRDYSWNNRRQLVQVLSREIKSVISARDFRDTCRHIESKKRKRDRGEIYLVQVLDNEAKVNERIAQEIETNRRIYEKNQSVHPH